MRCIPAAIALLLIVPSVAAHNTVESDDGEYFITIGHSNEPTTTWMKTGLDLTIRENVDGEGGDEVPGAHNTLTATYISPGGEEMTQPLETQHGAVGRYSFSDPFYLTEPGQYRLQLSGTIENTTVDGTYDVSGPVPAWGEATFPDVNTMTNGELQDEIADLASQVAALQSQVDQLEAEADAHADEGDDAGTTTPGPGFVLVALAMVALAFLARRQ